jgi:hypothetical protein
VRFGVQLVHLHLSNGNATYRERLPKESELLRKALRDFTW